MKKPTLEYIDNPFMKVKLEECCDELKKDKIKAKSMKEKMQKENFNETI